MRKKIESKWTLRGSTMHIPLNLANERSLDRYYVTDEIEATVPGGIHLDLFNAGIIDNPYYDENSKNCEWTENRWWIYETNFKVDRTCSKKRYILFEGLDCDCEVFVNGKSAGCHNNMFTPMKIDITDISDSDINLKALFKGADPELGQYGRTSESKTQRSRFGFGWDFATRIANIGIWRDVWLEYVDDVALEEAKIYTDYDGQKGTVNAEFVFSGFAEGFVNVKLYAPDGELSDQKTVSYKRDIQANFVVENPKLWYPNGMGDHPLYTVELEYFGETAEYKTGIRSLKYMQNPGGLENALPYTIVINGEPVYVKGNNKVPFDHLYGNVDTETYEWYVKALVNENINLVRVWGGGIIETEEFYDLCDKNGIMIWQDFIQSSSSIDHVPSKKDEFLKKAHETAVCAAKIKRNHVSLVFWCGGNELTDENVKPITYADENIAMHKSIMDTLDPLRLFLPSTPSGDVYGTEFENPLNGDVHAPWAYDYEDYYKMYNNLKLLQHSEFGVSSAAHRHWVFLKENNPHLKKWSANKHHGEYWWHSFDRDSKIYGEFKNPDEYVPYSQWTQAEALRYTIECERRKAPRTSGSMIWQLNEPWPNSDCTNLVNYFGTPKMAYYWAKKAYSASPVSLEYDGIYFENGLNAKVCVQGDYRGGDFEAELMICDCAGKILVSKNLKKENLPYTICEVPKSNEDMFMVRLTCFGVQKEYFFSKLSKLPYSPSRNFKNAKLSWNVDYKCTDGTIETYVAKVKNDSSEPAYFVNPAETTGEYALLADEAYFTLLPGEEKEIVLNIRKKLGLFFDKKDVDKEIIFRCLNDDSNKII